MQYTSLDDITAETLAALIGTQGETKRLEYKAILPGKTDEDRAEFLKDVSALANTDGGDIVYGMAENQGIASAFVLIENGRLDTEINRLRQILNNGVRPRIPGVEIFPVEIEAGRSVVVVHVPASHIGPHQVTAMNSFRFHARHANGTYPLEVDELRDKILRQASLPERMREFRHSRVELIRSQPEDMPYDLDYERKLVMHFLPEQTFGRYDAVDVSQIAVRGVKLNNITAHAPVPDAYGMNYRTNIDGALYMKRIEGGVGWYVQVFNDGSVEFVDTRALWNSSNEAVLYPNRVEGDMFGGYDFAVAVFKELGIQGRFYTFATALGAKGLTLVTPGRMPLTLSLIGEDVTVGRDPAYFNGIVIEDMNKPAQEALYPIVAQLWRACAFEKPYSYDDNRNYNSNIYT